ncbi:hypothetical protein [Tropicibacter sp. S64]|uniref:hypothetical protein n=1 Tax=Tropicibacter sp. S64 TaxID=3415122 RepID=UPI003C7ADAFA
MKKLAILSTILATPLMAHPGHDAALTGAAHYAFSPIHGLGVLVLAGAVALVLRRGDRRKDDA